MESSFIELRCKEVVNVLDGKRLGHVVDIIFDLNSSRILGFMLPAEKTGWNLFKNSSQLFLPYSSIIRIGEDAILVELTGQGPPLNPFVLTQDE